MKFTIEHNPVFSILRADLNPGDSFSAESGAMMSMSPSVVLETKTSGDGGFFGAIKATLGGESLFTTVFRAEGAGEVIMAPGMQGEIIEIDLAQGQVLFAESGAYLASTNNITLSAKGSLRALLAGEGLFLQQISGEGKIFLASFGNIMTKTLAAGESYIVDSGHIVAFDSTMHYEITKASKGWFSTIVSGEGLTTRFTGPGRIWMQTRNLSVFSNLIARLLPTPSK